jgi:hypothetical protein
MEMASPDANPPAGMDFIIYNTCRYRYKATAGVCSEAMMKLIANTDGIAYSTVDAHIKVAG